MGRTRLGRFAAITVPATAVSVGLGAAMLNGMVGAALASSSSFQVTGDSAKGTGMELTANYVQAATSDANATPTNKSDALVSLKDGVVSNMCLAADTDVLGFQLLGIKITSSGDVSLGTGWTDLSADSLGGSHAELGETLIGYAQADLAHQDAQTSPGHTPGGFSMKTSDGQDAVDISDLDSQLYALTLAGLSLDNLAISASTTAVEGTC